VALSEEGWILNQLYGKPRERMLKATFDWVALDLRLVAWSGVYDFDETHETITDMAGPTLRGISIAITGKVVKTYGYARTDPVVIPGITVGPQVSFLTLCEYAAVPDNMPLLLYIDQAEGLPFVPNGLDWVVHPDWLDQQGWFRP
jgi:hypothetical protein